MYHLTSKSLAGWFWFPFQLSMNMSFGVHGQLCVVRSLAICLPLLWAHTCWSSLLTSNISVTVRAIYASVSLLRWMLYYLYHEQEKRKTSIRCRYVLHYKILWRVGNWFGIGIIGWFNSYWLGYIVLHLVNIVALTTVMFHIHSSESLVIWTVIEERKSPQDFKFFWLMTEMKTPNIH